jgi:anti-sigma B factor antagonist
MTQRDQVLEHQNIQGVHVLRICTSRLETSTPMMVLEDELSRILAEDSGAIHLVINLGEVEYLVTTALAKLVSCREKVLERDGSISLCSLQPAVAEMMEVTRFDELFDIYPTESAAVENT